MNKMLTPEELRQELDRPYRWSEVPGLVHARTVHRVRKTRLSFVRAWQRWRRGYSEEDTWSFDHFLSGVIAGGVRQLRLRGIGHPASMTMAEWRRTLHRIELGFRVAEKSPWEMTERDFELHRKAMKLFKRHYFDLWD